jgi:hypothetical protein
MSISKSWKSLPVFALSLFLFPAVTQAQHYKQTNLVSDIMGMAPTFDPNLKNPWGLTRSSTTPVRLGSPWWVGNNNSGTSTLYTGTGAIIPINGTGTVTVPPPKGSPAGTLSTPTGVVFNGSPTDFLIAPGKSAAFIFVTEDGTISGWAGGQNAVLVVDNSDNGGSDSAVYKGATSAEVGGKKFLYVTNFRSAKVEVYGTNFKRVHLDEDAFEAEDVPRGFAPFNVQNVGGTLFVTYAKQDAPRHDPVGNFRSGWIAAFNGFTHKFIGWVRNPDDSLVTIDGLWSLTFANDANAGPANSLFFTAGINNENDGLFGTLTPMDGLDGDEE